MQNPKKTPDSSDQMIILAIHRFSDPETSWFSFLNRSFLFLRFFPSK
jgi:hypothetical protein